MSVPWQLTRPLRALAGLLPHTGQVNVLHTVVWADFPRGQGSTDVNSSALAPADGMRVK